MKLFLNNQEVEAELDSNRDGSQFVGSAYYIDTLQDLTDDELDSLQEECDDEINANWRG